MTMPTISTQCKVYPPIPVETGLTLQIENLLLAVPKNLGNCAVPGLPQLAEHSQSFYLATNIGHSGAVPHRQHSPEQLGHGDRPAKFPNEANRVMFSDE